MSVITRTTRNVVLPTLLAVTLAQPSHAEELSEAKKGASFLTGATAGAVLGGPVGMFIGALTGAWVGEELEQADQLEPTRDELRVAVVQRDTARADLSLAQADLDAALDSNSQYAQLVLEQLELEMMFRTGDGVLSETGRKRLAGLASFLATNPQISIRLDGFADPRGDADYNLELSRQRAEYVAAVLSAHGIESSRIQVYGHGDSQTEAPSNDYDAYALERVVKINLSQPGADGFASNP